MSATFGFRDVDPREKPGLVRGVFDRVASRYDLMNDVMSAGVHRLWKDAMAARLNPQPGETIIDCAGGTGDMALSPEIAWAVGDAQGLPLPDACADAYVISFGIRNVTDIPAALREARRVLKPGGRFLCLEFSRPPAPALARLYDAYSFRVIPFMGEQIAGDRESYQYLVESIRRFPDQKTFQSLIEAAGFRRAGYTNFTGGVAALHHGWAV